MKGALPDWLRVMWFFAAPVALVFALRIAWEKTVWTILRGPQMVGFSLMHIHPLFSILGALCSYALILWLIPAIVYWPCAERKSPGSTLRWWPWLRLYCWPLSLRTRSSRARGEISPSTSITGNPTYRELEPSFHSSDAVTGLQAGECSRMQTSEYGPLPVQHISKNI